MFYKDKNGKSPIDVALENNLINSVNQMLDYMVVHQNSYVYAFIIEGILVEMINKGVTMRKLLNSNIIMTRFDYDEWPSLHSDTNKVIAGYDKSVFKMRYEYSNVFRPQWEEEQHKLDLELQGEFDTKAQKVYKINYYLNILTSVSQKDNSLMDALANTEEIEIYELDSVKDMLDFKWEKFARTTHKIGFYFHMTYILVLLFYIN